MFVDYASLEDVVKDLLYYRVDYSTATFEDLKALQLVLLIIEDVITSSEEMQYCYDFIRLDNKYTKCIKMHINQYKTSEIHRRTLRKVIDESSSTERLSLRDKIYDLMERTITLLYSNIIMQSISESNVLTVANIFIANTKIPNIKKIIGELTDDDIDNRDYGVYTNIECMILPGLHNSYKQIEFGEGIDGIKDSFYTLNKIRVKNIDAYVSKCSLMDLTDTNEYKTQVVIEFISQILYITIKIEESMANRGTGRGLVSLTSKHYKRLLRALEKYGYNDSKIDDCIGSIQLTLDNSYIKDIRDTYTYITPEVITDKQLFEMNKLDLAGINYRIKLGEKI